MEDLTFDWRSYLSLAEPIQIARETTVFEQFDVVTRIYVVESGRVRLCLTSADGDEKTIMIVGKNGVIGELGLFDSGEYVTTAITSSDSTLYAFNANTFKSLIETNPDLVTFILFNMSRKFRTLAMQSLDLSYTSAQYRVVKSLRELANTYGVPHELGTHIRIRFTHQEMANLAGTTRVTVAQVFGQLERSGLLQKVAGHIVITSLAQLEGLLSSPKTSHFKYKDLK